MIRRAHAGADSDRHPAFSVQQLKHELRTPLNHLVGYSGLIRDIAHDLQDKHGETRAESLCKAVAGIGGQLEDSIRNLSAPSLIQGMRTKPAFLDASQLYRELDEWGDAEPYTHDLQKMRASLDRLITLLRSVSAAS